MPHLKIQCTKDFCHFNIKSRRTKNERILLYIENFNRISNKTSRRSEIKLRYSIKNKSLFNSNKKDIEKNENYNKKSHFEKKLSINNNKSNNQDLMNAYKENNKIYEMNKLLNSPTVVSEEPGYEESLTRNSSFNIASLRTNFLKNNNKRIYFFHKIPSFWTIILEIYYKLKSNKMGLKK